MDKIETIAFIKKRVEDLLTFFDLNVEADVSIEDDVILVSIPRNDHSSILIGRGAETLRALQHILSMMLRNSDAAVTRINLDIADYKKQHAEKIS